MEKFRVYGGRRLGGTVRIGAAKNAVLPILASTVLTSGRVTIRGCPSITDVDDMLSILSELGCAVKRDADCVTVDASAADCWQMPESLSKRLRSSIFMMGPLLGRFRRARVTYPGGCEIGTRPIDLHLKGLAALGVTLREENGMIELNGDHLTGGEVLLDFPSVGATENIMMACVLAPGRTVILNAAREPEIVDLARFLNRIGARIEGAGDGRIVVDGVKELSGGEYTPVPDRIVAGTLLIASAITGGSVTLTDARASDMGAVIGKLRECGCEIEVTDSQIALRAPMRLNSVSISTHPFPGYPTDMQAQMMALMCVSDGVGVVVENVFENRYAHAAQLRRMGARIMLSGRVAVVYGTGLRASSVTAEDLRGGAALTLAALAADGVSEVYGVSHIDRGYDRLDEMLSAMGAKIERIPHA